MDILPFLLQYKWVILFYLALVLFLIWKRKQLVVQAKVIVLYRTLMGVKFIKRMAEKHRPWVILFGYIGVGAAYVGSILISLVLFLNLYNLFATPEAASGVSLVLPGINVPGMGILSFWYWLLAIFIIAVVHEFSHGVVAKAHNLEIKSTGLVVLGPIIGAFVEPDEKKVEQQQDIVQYSIFAAGPFSNIVLGVVALLLMSFALTPLQNVFLEPVGFSFAGYYDETYPAAQAGLKPGTIISSINGVETESYNAFYEEIYCVPPQSEIKLSTEKGIVTLTTVSNPENAKKSFIGVKEVKNEFVLKEKYKASIFYSGLYEVISWLNTFMKWLYLLSVGIGLFNLLPLPIVDGGRIFKLTLEKVKGKTKGGKYFSKLSFFFLLLLLANLLVPAVRWLLNLGK